MAASPVEVVPSQWRGLEPEGRGHELMQTWALFRRGGERDGLPRDVSGYLREPLDKEHVNEPESVMAIDRMLARLYLSGYEHAVDIAKRFYLSDLPIREVAKRSFRTEGFVRLTLRGICALAEEKVPA